LKFVVFLGFGGTATYPQANNMRRLLRDIRLRT
jgi:hypothetical protein